METITEKISQVTKLHLEEFSKDSKYNELKDYFLEMKSKGFITPKRYTIPPLDTVGKRLYQSK
jgi:hypothetical protein